MAKKFEIGEVVWYKIKSDDIRKGTIRNYASNVNGRGQEYYLVSGSEFWFKPEQLKRSQEEFEN